MELDNWNWDIRTKFRNFEFSFSKWVTVTFIVNLLEMLIIKIDIKFIEIIKSKNEIKEEGL